MGYFLSNFVLAQCFISIPPENVIKVFGFLIFSRPIEMEHLALMGFKKVQIEMRCLLHFIHFKFCLQEFA